MKNKYQEALDNIVFSNCSKSKINLKGCKECSLSYHCNTMAKDLILTLQELVDKETPMKPKFIGNEYESHLCCKGCSKPIINVWSKKDYKPNYCHYCGQKLDWK